MSVRTVKRKSLKLAVAVLLSAALTSGCMTVSSAVPGDMTHSGDIWFVEQMVSPGPAMVRMVLSSKVFYCPMVEDADGQGVIEACYEARLPKDYR